jgi:outer membrane protein OmpA-like peptidoglycan-associated protein
MSGPFVALILALLLTDCGHLPQNLVVLIPDEDGATGRAIVSNARKTAELDRSFTLVETRPGQPPGMVVMATKEQIDTEFASVLNGTPQAPIIFRVFFGNAQSDLDAPARTVLDTTIAAAKASSYVNISVVGNTDAIGNSAGENLPLSQRRAESVRDALVAAGISADMIDISYFGANNPLVPNVPGVAEPLNRRVDITIR